MSTTELPTAQPVGHQGARVDISERPALAVNGWIAVVVLAGCVVGDGHLQRARHTPGCGRRYSSSSWSSRRW